MNLPPPLKKPKVEEGEEPNGAVAEARAEANGSVDKSSSEEEDEEEVLIALIEHRTIEVERNRRRMSHYKEELAKAEKKLKDAKSKLVLLRRRDCTPNNNSQAADSKDLKIEQTSPSSSVIGKDSPLHQFQTKPKIIIPAVKAKTSQTLKIEDSCTKRKREQKEHKELVSLIRSCSSASTVHCQRGCLIPSQHKRKLRSLLLCPTNDQLFVTSALDGVINLWQVQGRGSSANLLSSTDSISPKQRRWPEDAAWHPEGSSLFSVYSADGGDSQISVLNLNETKSGRVCFLEEKPHVKGIINNIVFMPWDNVCFVTGGSDHAVMLWTEKDGDHSWKPKTLHRNLHSSAVMGVTGMQQKQMVLSVGADKRIIGFDVPTGRADYKHQIESKCMSVLPNPCDFNLFMVQTGTPERQLRLFDIRLRQTEIHAFGWKQESSESQSALINQAWSPDGLYLTSGSADPVIHIFDIRYHSHKPSQSVQAHQKRVFKAVWHQTFPLLISISSDLNIGLHKIT